MPKLLRVKKTVFLVLLIMLITMLSSIEVFALPAATDATYYKIIAKHSGKALNVSGGSVENSANVEQFTDNESPSEQWLLKNLGNGYYTIMSRSSGKVLNINESSSVDGANVEQYDANGTSGQQWLIESVGTGFFKLTARSSGLVLNVEGSSSSNSANVNQRTWVNTDNQKWQLIPVNTPVTGSNYKIIAKHTNKALKVRGASNLDGAQIEQSVDTESAEEQWLLEDQDNGYYKLTARNSGKVLSASSVAEGADINQYAWNGSDAQLWRIEDIGDGYSKITNKSSNKVLSIFNGDSSDGTKAVQYTYNSSNNYEKWQLVKFETLNKMQDVYNDMFGMYQGTPHGVPHTYSWYNTEFYSPLHFPTTVYNNPNVPVGTDPGSPNPKTWDSLTLWGQVYEAEEGNTATNTRVSIKDMTSYYLSFADNQWHQLTYDLVPSGALFHEDFHNNDGFDAHPRTEPDGSISVIPGQGYLFHFWPTVRAHLNPSDVKAIYGITKARLIKSDNNNTDDRDQASFIMNVGFDYWYSTTAQWDNFSTNGFAPGGRFRYVKKDWQTFTAFTCAPGIDISDLPPLPGSYGSSYTSEKSVFVDDNSSLISYTGQWSTSNNTLDYSGTEHSSVSPTSSASFTFTGSSISWLGRVAPDGGKAKVYIDGVLQTDSNNLTEWDTYNQNSITQLVIYQKQFMPFGTHTIKVQLTNSKNTSSSGYNQVIDGFFYTTSRGVSPAGVLDRTGWIVSASSDANGDIPSKAIDGNVSTRWTTGKLQSGDEWYKIDMGSAKTFNKLVLDAANSSGDYARNYAVYVSSDGSNWGSAIATVSGSAISTITFASQSKRYIRINQTGSTNNAWWSINELNVYSDSTPTPPPLGVLDRTGWIVSASSDANGDIPSKAIDGNVSTRWTTGKLQSGDEWYKIDMGSAKTFNKVVLDATNSSGDYARNYAVYVSSDGSNWGSAIATVSGSAISTITFASQSKRYIRINQTGSTNNAWWSINELNVYSN